MSYASQTVTYINNYHKEYVCVCVCHVHGTSTGEQKKRKCPKPAFVSVHTYNTVRRSEFQDLRLFPAEFVATEVAVAGGLLVDWTFKIKISATHNNKTHCPLWKLPHFSLVSDRNLSSSLNSFIPVPVKKLCGNFLPNCVKISLAVFV